MAVAGLERFTMSADKPPSIDPQAASRWAHRPCAESPWLHEEVGRRMAERLQWIRLQPSAWVDWHPVRGGLQAHAAVAARYPRARAHVVESAVNEPTARAALREGGRWPWSRAARTQFGPPAPQSVQMVWANMGLHMLADPLEALREWHSWLQPDGFLMFSCLGPDTLLELRAMYRRQGWPEPAHAFTDMHDWGDMLVQAGFAEPVMDMEQLTLTFEDAPRLLAELRGLGRNLSVNRGQLVRGRRWHARLLESLGAGVAPAQRLALRFEIVYGHAFRGRPRAPLAPSTDIPLAQMRDMLRGRPARGG